MRKAILTTRISRKVSAGKGSFSSCEISHSIEVEVEFEDKSDLQDKASNMRKLLVGMVDQGLDDVGLKPKEKDK